MVYYQIPVLSKGVSCHNQGLYRGFWYLLWWVIITAWWLRWQFWNHTGTVAVCVTCSSHWTCPAQLSALYNGTAHLDAPRVWRWPYVPDSRTLLQGASCKHLSFTVRSAGGPRGRWGSTPWGEGYRSRVSSAPASCPDPPPARWSPSHRSLQQGPASWGLLPTLAPRLRLLAPWVLPMPGKFLLSHTPCAPPWHWSLIAGTLPAPDGCPLLPATANSKLPVIWGAELFPLQRRLRPQPWGGGLSSLSFLGFSLSHVSPRAQYRVSLCLIVTLRFEFDSSLC